MKTNMICKVLKNCFNDFILMSMDVNQMTELLTVAYLCDLMCRKLLY